MTSSQQTTVIAVFPDASAAQAAAKDLQSIGVSRENMFIEASRGAASGSGFGTTSRTTDEPGTPMPNHEGGVGGWFKSLFGGEEEDDRSRYENAVGQGNVMLSVHAREDQHDQIADVLERHSPIDVHGDTTAASSSEVPAAAAASRSNVGGTARNTKTENATGGDTIPVVEEEMQIGKRNVLRGGVRVYSRVVERPVEESINLSEEHVSVDRRPVNREATEADFRNTKGNTIEVQEYAEEAVVGKTARVVEEVRVGKETTQHQEEIHDSVRHTEVNVEQVPGGQARAGSGADYDTDFRNDFKTRYGSSGGSYDTYEPSYRYGSEMANDPRYKGRSYDDVESELKSDYQRRNPDSTWENMKDSVRYGWDKMTGNRSQAARR